MTDDFEIKFATQIDDNTTVVTVDELMAERIEEAQLSFEFVRNRR